MVFKGDDFFDLNQVPAVDFGQLKNVLDRQAMAERIGHIPSTIGTRLGQQSAQFIHRTAVVKHRVKARHADLEAAQGFLHRLLEVTTDGHDFANRLHLGRQHRLGLREFFEGKARNFGHDVVNGRLETGRCGTASNLVIQFVQGVTNGQLGRHFGDRKAGGFGGQRRRARDPRIHFDHNHTTGVGIDAKLHVRATGFDTDFSQHRDRGVAHDLVFFVGQSLRRCDGNRVARVDPHGVKVFDRANDDAVVVFVTHHLHLVLFPAQQRFIDQQLVGR